MVDVACRRCERYAVHILILAALCAADRDHQPGAERLLQMRAVSNPSVATARIEVLEPATPRVGDIMNATGSGDGAPPLQFAWDFGDGTWAAACKRPMFTPRRDAIALSSPFVTPPAISPATRRRSPFPPGYCLR